MAPFSLYIHIPYCDSKCPYCDFNSYAVKRWPEAAYRAALIAEMRAYATAEPWQGATLQTIFLGGGTPSLFAPESIAALLAAARQLWPFEAQIEITMEANPGTVDLAKLRGFRAAGINRMSFGVQSFHPAHLERLGRIHSAAEAITALEGARQAGFDNFSLDLMFAIPGQTVEEWEADLATAIALRPAHISAYNLTYEDGTAFGAWKRSGALAPLPEEAEVAMFNRTRTILAAHGYPGYEISNFAPPGQECAHNLNYWRAGGYLGVGAGAHAFAAVPGPGRRWANERSPDGYLARIAADGQARVSEETLSAEQARGEFVFLALRLADGFAPADFASRFGIEFDRAFPHVDTFVRDGFLCTAAGRWQLTPRGLLFADSIFSTFL
ncbi:MAG: radical SAM family heme chaperone HemW [Candidatus Binatia bacterium]